MFGEYENLESPDIETEVTDYLLSVPLGTAVQCRAAARYILVKIVRRLIMCVGGCAVSHEGLAKPVPEVAENGLVNQGPRLVEVLKILDNFHSFERWPRIHAQLETAFTALYAKQEKAVQTAVKCGNPTIIIDTDAEFNPPPPDKPVP